MPDDRFSKTHPANLFSYCPQCGTKGLVLKGEKMFSCVGCGLSYFVNPAPAVAVILEFPDGRIVLARRKHDPQKGMLDLPGGFVDMNESIEGAVKREIFEELGIEITQMSYLGSFPNEYVYKGVSYFTCDLAFVCPIPAETSLHPSDDVSEAVILKPDDIDFQQISFPSIANILQLYLNRMNNRR